jgi:hypothetical protein
MNVLESATSDLALADAAAPGMTVLIVIHGTNLVDFDDEGLAGRVRSATDAGADVLIRLEP